MNGGRFDFDDGGTYCGGWEEAKAHGHGVCTGPDGKGEFAGAWHYGFEVSGVYTWPSGNTYEGQWQNGRRHGLGVESRGRWVYQGEWAQGLKGRYGLRQSRHSQANYLGTWVNGLHDGYGTETYVDGGTYKGQWLRGMRHGYGIRTSAPFGVASKYRARSQTHASLTSLRSEIGPEEPAKEKKGLSEGDDEFRGGFVLRVRSDAPATRRRSLSERSLAVKRSLLSNLRIKKQHSTGDIHQRVTSMTGSLKSSGSMASCASDDDEHHRNTNDFYLAAEERVEMDVVETYRGEWKNDKRSGFGICERTDSVRYAGEWFNNRKHGYGVTFFKDGTKEEGRYKNNVLVCSTRRKGLLFVRSSKLRERIEASVETAKRAADMAQERAQAAVDAAERAKDDANTARIHAAQFDPNFRQPGLEHIRHARHRLGDTVYQNHVSFESSTSAHQSSMDVQVPLSYHNVQVDPNQLAHPISFANPQMYQPRPQLVDHANPSGSPQHAGQYYEQQPYASNEHAVQVDQAATPILHQHYQQNAPDERSISLPVADAPFQTQPLPAQSPPSQLNNGQQPQPGGPVVGNHVNYNGPVQPKYNGPIQAPEATPAEDATPNIVRRPKRGRANTEHTSTMSLSDDHYDQYTMNRSTSVNGPQLRRNRPSLTRQSEVLAEGVLLNRRSTLASARDRPAAAKPATNSVFSGWENGPGGETDERGSLPNLDELAHHGLSLKREDAARLASQRRQEAQRLQEEEEMLRANLLRYLYHPSLRNWAYNNKGLILLVAFNISLIYVLFYLLTYDRNQND